MDQTGLEPATSGVVQPLSDSNQRSAVELLAHRDFMKKSKADKAQSDEYARFEQLAKQLISVPKSEIDKREAESQRQKKTAKKKRIA